MVATGWRLSDREGFVLDALMRGLTPKEIAAGERLSIETVRSHLAAIRVALDAPTIAVAVAAAYMAGWRYEPEPAVRARCRHGHDLTPGNVSRHPTSGLRCVTCHRESDRRSRERKTAERVALA